MTGGITRGAVKDPPAEGALAVPGKHSTSHMVHEGDPSGSGMDGPGPNSKRDYQHKSHHTVRDPVEGGGGSDIHLPLRQPADAQHPPWFQGRKRYRDKYNEVKARPGAC